MSVLKSVHLQLSQWPQWLLMLVVLLTASGCGFHLRTYSFSGSVDTFAVTGKRNLDISAQVRRGLKQAGLNEVAADEAALNLELLDERRERRSISTSQGAVAAEYETRISVHYRILGADGVELAPAAWIERQRVYRVDQTNIVGSSEEQALLERELQQDVVGQIIRAMDAVSRNLEPANAG